MKENRNKGGMIVAALSLAVVLVALPSLYVLSVGPAILFLNWGWLSDDVYFAVYHPLVLFHQQSDVAEAILDWYVDLWASK